MRSVALVSVFVVSSAAYATGEFVLPQSIESPSASAYDAFGGDVAVSGGSLLFVGVRGADQQGLNAGAVEIYARSGGAWSFVQRPSATGLAAGDQLGESVAGNATWLAAGASRHDASGADAGAVWLFKKGTTSWAYNQKLIPPAGSAGIRFGSSVAVSNTAVAVGAPLGGTGGSATVYKLQSGAWVVANQLPNPTAASGDRFGESIAVTDSWLAIGAPFDDAAGTDAGAVHLYSRTPLNWVFVGTLLPSTSQPGQHFGQSVSLSGTRLAVGAYGADTGADESGRVEIFDYSGGTWVRSAIVAPGSPTLGGNFGWDVSVSGGSLAVGVPGGGAVPLAGEAHLLTLQPGGAWTEVARARISGGEAQDLLGSAVAIDGGQLVAAAPTAHPSAGYRGAVGAADLSADCNSNAVPDVLELAAGGADCDSDGQLDACEANADGDALPDDCDGCPADPLKTSPGACGCGVADADTDGDGVLDCLDGCPSDPLKTSPGACGCGVAESDSDADGTPDCIDGCPSDPAKIGPGVCGCGVADADTDGDGVADCVDGCPSDPNKTAPGVCGCGVSEADSDGDGTADCLDGCPSDPAKTAPGVCGCGALDTDSDGDGAADCIDGCPSDPAKTAAGVCGCGVPDSDSDADGTLDCLDGCPTDPLKTSPGDCGCGVPELDSDSDGSPDCVDGCPADPFKTSPGDCGCGVAETDGDDDGVPDCIDECPIDPTNNCDLVFEVPSEYPTIQAAIDAAPSDRASVVQVASGVYNQAFDLAVKDIVIRGAVDGSTVLDGSGIQRSIARLTGALPASAGLEFLTFRAGVVGSELTPGQGSKLGGAVLVIECDAFIRDCVFEDCRADFGGAVYLRRSRLAVERCTFESNLAGSDGGGMFAFQCSGVMTASAFIDNGCGVGGGGSGAGSGSSFKSVGARAPGESLLLVDVSAVGGTAVQSGSSIEHLEDAGGRRGILRLRGCTVTANSSPIGAGGLRVLGSQSSCVIESNSLVCNNSPRNIDGPYLNDGTSGVCDCEADANLDGQVNANDLALVLTYWGAANPVGNGDVTHSGAVDAADLAFVLGAWGICE